MGEDYTWLRAKQNERFRSHDFWLKLWIQYTTTYKVMRYPKSKNYKLEKKPKWARLRYNRNKILDNGFDGTGQVFLKWLLCFYLKGINV